MNPELVTRNSLLRFFYFHEECHYKSLEWEIRPSAPSSTASLSQVFSVSLRCGALSIYRTSGLTWSALFISGNFLDFTGFYRVLPSVTGFFHPLYGVGERVPYPALFASFSRPGALRWGTGKKKSHTPHAHRHTQRHAVGRVCGR